MLLKPMIKCHCESLPLSGWEDDIILIPDHHLESNRAGQLQSSIGMALPVKIKSGFLQHYRIWEVTVTSLWAGNHAHMILYSI
jgi:hypothetical protein